ncbi:hypothetical protein CAPTEDRAFT_228002 [Capitella teleta]|uniref:Ig-like domain-containing protein n=1 Tax=Capitella teleta TaxID=283909 RepID=R7UC38_CAPTE|nr:hypothetical protein CAPTEDRAFT_228002 [Capitella teleta]|eukprot:ELU01358.1 hypothetical protein CAPTEDRAFT_228002 [Capitella teleta]
MLATKTSPLASPCLLLFLLKLLHNVAATQRSVTCIGGGDLLPELATCTHAQSVLTGLNLGVMTGNGPIVPAFYSDKGSKSWQPRLMSSDLDAFNGDVLLSGDIDGLVEGDSFTLECSSNNQGDTLLLFRNGSPIENGGHFAVESTTHEGAPVLSVTVTDAEMADGGSYTCRSNEDYFDEDTLQVNILAGTTEPEIDIVDPEADSLMVEIGATLNMKCIGGRGSRPVWQHNGFDLTGQTPGGRVLITDSVDVNTGNKVSLLSREEMTLKDAGQYSCQDKNAYSNHDEVVVSVEGASEQAAVEIFEPTESKLRLLPAHMLTLKCQSGKSVDLKWSKDGDAIEADEIEGFIINVSVDEEKGVKTSMLSKQQASTTDSGVYFCSSLDDSSSDKVSVLVADEAAEPAAAQDDQEEGAACQLQTASGVILVAMTMVALAIRG